MAITTKLDFRPDIDGFAFANSWTYEQAEKDKIWSIFDGVVATTILGLVPLIPPDPIAIGAFIFAMKSVIDKQLSQKYGLCGGMAYAALDYYKAGLVIDRGFPDSTPTHTTPQGGKLRDYIWQRLLDSLISGGAALTTIEWMFILNVLSRPDILLSKTKNEWVKLKQHIDSGTPWPICLIGTASSPFDNHQVLAYGYADNGNGTGTIFVYDNNLPHPDVETTIIENTIHLDFRGSQLQAKDTQPNPKRGPLKGFFCTSYQFNQPPEIVGLLNAVAPSSGKPGQTVSLDYTATNAGFGPTPPMKLYVLAVQRIPVGIEDIVPSDAASGAVASSDTVRAATRSNVVSGMALPSDAESRATIPSDSEGAATIPAETAANMLPPDGPGPHRYIWRTFHFVSPTEPTAPIGSGFSPATPHSPAPTNVVSRQLTSPIKKILPSDNSTWGFSAQALLTSKFTKPDGTRITRFVSLPRLA